MDGPNRKYYGLVGVPHLNAGGPMRREGLLGLKVWEKPAIPHKGIDVYF